MKVITASFFTTLSWRQTKAALKYFLPWQWRFLKKGKQILELEKLISKLVGFKYAKSFYNARSAIFHGLKACGVGEGDEVILQAYTCVSVANAIIALTAKPVYVDIKQDDLNIDPEKIERAITSKTKAVIIQHTFGTPADINQIKAIVDKNSIILVEDCAHSMGAKYSNQIVGTFGKFSVFSFGRDKVISGVNGGILGTNDLELFNKLPQSLPLPSTVTILRNLIYPVIAQLSLKTYYFLSLGKLLITLAKVIKLIPPVTSKKENQCQDKKILNYCLPNCLADLILRELSELNRINANCQKLADYYHQAISNKNIQYLYPKDPNKNSIYLRLVILTSQKRLLYNFMKRRGVILGNWYNQAVAPLKIDLKACGYQLGSCPIAEKIATQTLNLPNHSGITLHQAEKVARLINQWQP